STRNKSYTPHPILTKRLFQQTQTIDEARVQGSLDNVISSLFVVSALAHQKPIMSDTKPDVAVAIKQD
ncbi:MAG TPA: hypothetical protein DEA79_24905, partial [Cyanobacteria bacterium UBA11153]|nr:hypothetical protein [Cyanobacteria bacterium UBA11153]